MYLFLAGTKNPKYVLENIAAFDVRLSKEELAELEEAVPRSAVCIVLCFDTCQWMQRWSSAQVIAQRSKVLIHRFSYVTSLV